MPNKVDYRTFSQRVKNKYPEYINMGDLELAQMWVSQNPQYGEFVMFDQQPVKKKDQAAPSFGEQGGLQYASTGDPIADKAQTQSALKSYSQKKDKSDEIGFWENIGNNIINGSNRMWNDITQTGYEFGMISRGVPIVGAQALGKTARPFKEDYKTKTRQEMGLLEESAAAFANSIPLMIGSIGLGGAAGVGARVAGTLPMFISGFQESGREAEELGITDPLDRLTFQTIGGTIEGASELIMPDASLIRPLRKRALEDLVRVGAKGLSKADAGRYVAEFTEKVAKEVGEEYAVEIGNVLRNASFAAVGYDKAAPEMKSARDYAVMTLSAALGAGTFAGVGTGVNAAFAKSTAIKKAAENPEAAAQAAADLVDAGKLTQEQADAFLAKVASVNRAVGKMPKDVDPDVAVNTADLLNEKVDLEESVKALEEEKNNVDPSFHQGIDDQIAQITGRINELTQQITEFQMPTITLDVERIDQAAPEAPQMAPAEVSPEVGMEIPQEDQGVLQVINSVIQPISSDIEARMNNAEEIPMSEIEAVVDALIDAQQSVRSQEGARTRQTQGGFVTEFGALSDQQKRNFDTLIEQQINKLLNYEFATITTTEQAGEKTKTAGLVATPREGRPLPESVVSRDRFDGAGVRVGGKGAGRITVKRIPGFGGRSVYGVSFGNRKGVTPVEDLEFDNLEFVAPEVLGDGSLNVRVRDAKSGLEFTITDPELSMDLAIAAQLKEAGRKEFPQPAFLEAVREVTQGQPTQVTTFPNLGRTGTTPAAVGVEPQTEQDVRQETNAPQEGRAQGENAAPVPQEEGRQEGQVTPPAVAQEGETPPAAKRTRKTEQQKADEGKAILDKLKETLRALKAKPGGGANIDLTFGVVPISKAVWNTAIDTAILAIDAGQSIAQAVKAASDYVSSKIDGDWGKAKFEQYMDERFGQAPLNQQIDDVAESAGISPKNFRDLYRVNRELFGLNQSEAMSAAIAMDKMIDVMAKRAGVSKTEMYGKLNFKKATEQDPPQGVKFQVDAWHGSPYQFDKFTTEKIGTGEGAQAFGWGLYFTDLESIARRYAETLGGLDAKIYANGKEISYGHPLFDYQQFLIRANGDVNSVLSELKDIQKLEEGFPKSARTKAREKAIVFLEKSPKIKIDANKALYKVSLHKGKTPDQYTWLEWDKPVGEENAKRILTQLKKNGLLEKAEANWSRKNMSGSFSGKESLENDLKNLRGDHFYERFLSPRVTPVAGGLGTSAINRLFDSAKDASLFLLDAGIDGNKYPAESIARGATSDTARGFNYVVFDENAVSIEEVIKFQEDAVKARGAMMITLDGQATIYALTDPNVSTPLHELAHVFEHYLTDEEKATVQEWAKTKDWTIKTSEAFARGFEKYLAEGKAPTPALQKIFDNFKQWLTDIYRGIVGSDIDVELNEPMRDLYAKMFEFTGEDGQSNFEKWKGDNNLLVGPDIQDAKTGEPIVVRAYHGTTNEFYEFDSSVKGSVEGHLGKINYFTSDYQDAAINYLSEGTDLTNRVEGRTEQIISELENNYDDYNESIPELSKKYGYTEEELEDDFVSFRSLARDLAKKELYGGTNKVLDVFIKLNNPVVLGKGSTWFQTLNISETDLDQAAQEIADENDISVEEAKQDYDFEIRDRAIENAGYENLAVDALSSALRSNGYRGASASEILGDNLYESEIDLNRLEGELRRNDKAGLYENEEGELASSQVVSDFLKNLGFDGIILTDVSSRFRGMGLGSSTSHIHVFDEFANQIKLADGSNTTFGETRDIRFQLDKAQPQQQAQPEAKPSPKVKTVFHSGTLEGKGNIYVSPIREQANEYSSMSGAPVLEFEINENAMAPESEVRDLIRSLGLKLPEGYNLDELFLYEALDTRVKSSLSQGDIDKLYATLKDRGYEGISFRDEDIRGVKREGIDNFIVFDKSSLSQQQAQPKTKVETGEDVAKMASEMQSDQGFSDFTLRRIASEDYTRETASIDELRKNDPSLEEYIAAGEMRETAVTTATVPPIVSSNGEVIDGYNRILQAVENGDKSIEVLKGRPKAQPEAQVEATAKALDRVDTQPLKRQLGIEANWDMIGEGDTISGKDPVLAYIQKQLPSWNRESQRGNINPNSKITYDVVRGEYGGIDQKGVVEAKDENGVVIGIVRLDAKGGIEHIAVAPEFRGKGVSDKLIQTLKANNPQLDLSKTKLRSKGFEKAFGNKIIAEAYHKAKADGSNPKLVQAVEDLLGQAAPEAKPEKTIAEQRKEFRETAKKYFDGLKKMGIAFDPERNSKEDIAFLKALAKYIKLELDAGMVTFKGFLEKTANLIEGFNEKAVVAAAKEAWAKEVVKAYPKLYAKYNAAKRKELEREIKDIRKTMIRRIMDMTEPKIVNFKSQLKTEKRRLSKEAAAQLAAIRNAYDAKTMMAMEPQDLMELLNLTEGIYKEGRSEIKALNESLDEAAQIQGEEMLAAIASKDKRLEKLDSKEAASKMLAKKAGVVVAVKGDDRVIMKEEKDLEALDGEGYTFLFLNTTSDKFVDRSFLDSVVSFFSGKLRTINENARDLRTALELIKSKSKESQGFINGLVAKMNKASVTKARKSEEWSSILKAARTKAFGPDIKFGYTNWMNAIAKVNGKPLNLTNGRGVSIGPINNGKIISLYRQLMDPTNLVKTDGVRKIDLSDESIQSIIDYMNLPANKPGKSFALDLTDFFRKVAADTKVVLENNGYNSTKLDEKRYNAEDFEGDEFIAQVMGQFADTRTEGFIPYTPIQATESPDTAQGVEINEDDLLDSGDLQKNFSVISNNMITRRPGGVIVPTDIRQTLNAYTAGMANMNAKLPLLRETQSVFSNRNLKAMSNAFAPQFTENLKVNYISFMTDRVTKVDSSKSWQAIKTWLMTSTAIPMFLNFKSSILQMLASPNFMVSYDFSKYIDASKKLFGDPALSKKIFTEIIDLPTVRQRFGGRFSPDSRIISEEVGRYGKVAINIPFTNISISAKEILSKGYIFSSIGDVLSIAIGGAPIYYDISETNKRKYMSEGMSALEAEAKAKKDAEEKLFEIIQETQQSSEAMYLSEFQKQSITRIFSSFATATMQYYRKARRAAARMKNKEGNQLQNAYEILHYTAINAAVFQFFSSMLMDAVSGPGEDELEEMSRQERMDFVRYMEDVMATVAQGTGGMGVALQAIILAIKESQKSGKPEKIAESALRTMPAVRMKYDAAINTMREWKRGDYVRSLTRGAELANIPADRIRSLGLQVSDALMENLDAQERIARLMGFRTESWMREKKQGEIWNGVQSAVDKSTPAERQRAISNTKSAYRDLFQLYGKRYAEATTEAEKARVDSIASKELLNVYNHRQGGPEFTEELQKLFNQSAEFNSLPKDMQKLKNMETNRKIGDVVEEVLSLEKKSKQKAMEYWSSLVNNGILSKNEIERVREEYNTRKGLQ